MAVNNNEPYIFPFLLSEVTVNTTSTNPNQRGCMMLNFCDSCGSSETCVGNNVCISKDGGSSCSSKDGCYGADICANCSNCSDKPPPEADMQPARIISHKRRWNSITLKYRNPDSHAVSEALHASRSLNGGYGRHSDLATGRGDYEIQVSVNDSEPRYFFIKRYNKAAGEVDSEKYEVEAYASKPNHFHWSTAVERNELFSGLTASEWNGFVYKIRETLDYYGYGEEYEFTVAYQEKHNLPLVGYDISFREMVSRLTVKSGQIFRATYFNVVREVIGSFVATGLSTKYAEDRIYADDFFRLEECLNRWIG